MKIEVGKYYITRSGEKVECAHVLQGKPGEYDYPVILTKDDGSVVTCTLEGHITIGTDIVEEWRDTIESGKAYKTKEGGIVEVLRKHRSRFACLLFKLKNDPVLVWYTEDGKLTNSLVAKYDVDFDETREIDP